MIRYALVRGSRSHREVAAYLPDNYRVVHVVSIDEFWPAGPGGHVDRRERPSQAPVFVIEGRDVAGWTLDGYVIPRYGSGSIACEEIDLSHPIMKEVPANV